VHGTNHALGDKHVPWLGFLLRGLICFITHGYRRRHVDQRGEWDRSIVSCGRWGRVYWSGVDRLAGLRGTVFHCSRVREQTLVSVEW
jgi:hypothetical protein